MPARFPGLRIHGDLTLAWVRGHTWETLAQMVVQWDGGELNVPSLLCTDLASVPRIARPFASVAGPWARASVVHDYLYVTQPYNWSRADADRLFRELMRLDGVARWRRWCMWAGVRIGGWALWHF